jgi:hypothetical protein
MNLFIGPQDSSQWSLTAEAFTTSLWERWPAARVTPIEDPSDPELLTFALDGDEGPVEGALSRTGRILVLEYGWPRDLASVVVWFRRLAPAAEDLVMVNEGGGACAVIRLHTSLDEVTAVLS